MENKVKAKLIPSLLIAFFLAVGYFAISFTVKNISSDTPVTSKKESVEINSKIYDGLFPQSSSGGSAAPEAGYGRENPFAPYK